MLKEKEILNNKIDINNSLQGYYIYFLIKDNEIVYVGQTSNLWQRMSAHNKDKEFNYIYFEKIDKLDANYIENYYIIKFLPKYNKKLNANEYCLTFKELRKLFYCLYKKIITNWDIKKYLYDIKTFSYIDGITRIFEDDAHILFERILENKYKEKK